MMPALQLRVLQRKAVLFCLCALLYSTERGALAQQSSATDALLRGRVDDAMRLIQPALMANPNDGAAHLLLCRATYAAEQIDRAVEECTRAATLMPRDSAAAMWQARALGQQAANSNPISAYKLAGRVRTAFEHAHDLNPADDRAASDLADFYIQAPSLVGGSPDKAQTLATAMLTRSPARAHRLLGLIAENHKDYTTAGAEFHKEIAADAPVGFIDLSLFYQRQKQYDQATSAVAQALAADRFHGPVQMDAATVLTGMKRQPDVAERALRAYIASPSQTDEAPVFRAHLLLGKLLQRRGDKAGARAEYAAALALASQYAPAQKAMGSL